MKHIENMEQKKNYLSPSHPWLGTVSYKFSRSFFKRILPILGAFDPESSYAKERAILMKSKIDRGDPVHLVGFHSGSHGAGIALVEVTKKNGVNLITNNEEERYQGKKFYPHFPEQSVDVLLDQISDFGIKKSDIFAFLGAFDYSSYFAAVLRTFAEEVPSSISLLRNGAMSDTSPDAISNSLNISTRLGKHFGLDGKAPIIGMNHHGNHAYFSYAASPFALSNEPTLITVIDGNGDDSSISLYIAQGRKIKRIYTNNSFSDSLGGFYRFLSSTQGGWTPHSSEGRFMGAVAWGDQNRSTNPFYKELRQIIHLEKNGQIFLNRALANWHRQRWTKPYTKRLEEIIGPPIKFNDLWNPDAVLKIDIGDNNTLEQDRFDKAAAVQMIFEDALFHIIDHIIRRTGSSRLVLTGGTALNCLANSRLLELFDEKYYQNNFGLRGTRLHIWVPPTPGDEGTAMGSAYQFALTHGAPLGKPLQHAFYCGKPPTTAEIKNALKLNNDIGFVHLSNIHHKDTLNNIADLLAFIVSQNGIIGVYYGRAETGPRALGHRSILANPRNPDTLKILNQRVKFREAFRPLAPMATYEAAQRWFYLSEGASDDYHNAYNYMVLTAKAKPESFDIIPAVIHKDGSSRVQIVRESTDPFIHAYLKAMGRRVGAEVSVNTSLNVSSPIVQTPEQALDTLRRAKGMDGILLIGEGGDAFFAWHNIVDEFKDGGKRLNAWINAHNSV